jgi:ribonuclease P protein component
MTAISYRFPKSSRLHHRKEIQAIFQAGKSSREFPFLAYVVKKPFQGAPVSIAISVPKRRIKKAVHRNRVKRLVREAFRLNAPRFRPPGEYLETLHVVFVFIGDKVPDFKTVSAKIILTLQRLTGDHEADNHQHTNSSHTDLP